MSTRIKTCFISAPVGANLKILRNVLHEKGVRVVRPEEFPSGAPWSDEINSILSEVDLVIGVVTRARSSDSVLFELGQASALGRQIVLFAPPKFKAFRFDLQRFLVIRASLTNREAISFALDQLIAAPPPDRQLSTSKSMETYSLGQRANSLLRDVLDATTARQGRKLEELVASMIRESGVDVISESPNRDKSADLAIWSDALQPVFGNPLLVEVKVRIQGSANARRVVKELSASISSSGAAWGLLLYGEGPDSKSVWGPLPTNILVMSLSTLIMEMENRPFIDVVKDQRNQRMHGEHA